MTIRFEGKLVKENSQSFAFLTIDKLDDSSNRAIFGLEFIELRFIAVLISNAARIDSVPLLLSGRKTIFPDFRFLIKFNLNDDCDPILSTRPRPPLPSYRFGKLGHHSPRPLFPEIISPPNSRRKLSFYSEIPSCPSLPPLSLRFNKRFHRVSVNLHVYIEIAFISGCRVVKY